MTGFQLAQDTTCILRYLLSRIRERLGVFKKPGFAHNPVNSSFGQLSQNILQHQMI